MHLIDPGKGMLGAAPIVAGTISLALGSALAASIRKDNRVTISFFGDGATGAGVLYESMNFAALKKLPIIFACENNLYATHMPIRECRVENNIFKIAAPFCIESHEVDGNDVLQVYESGQRAINKCRSGEGPVFLEFLTYRFHGHVGPDDNVQGTHTDIRPKEEVKKWAERDPIKRFEKYLMDNRIMNEQELYNIKQEVRREVDEAHIFAKDNSLPDMNELTKYVYR
jgi:pyruvate dehydrogenase E1 component alpha subunit